MFINLPFSRQRPNHWQPTKPNAVIYGEMFHDELGPGKKEIPAHLPFMEPVSYYSYVHRVENQIHYATLVRTPGGSMVLPGTLNRENKRIHYVNAVPGARTGWYAEGFSVRADAVFKIGARVYVIRENRVYLARAPYWQRQDPMVIRSPERELLI